MHISERASLSCPSAHDAQGPIDGIAGVVGALIKRLDCREVGVVSQFSYT